MCRTPTENSTGRAKATPPPWAQYITDEWPPGWIGIRQNVDSPTLTETHIATVGRINDAEYDVLFITASRVGYPKALRCLKTAIEGWINTQNAALDNMEGASGEGFEAWEAWEAVVDCASLRLTALCDQWEALK